MRKQLSLAMGALEGEAGILVEGNQNVIYTFRFPSRTFSLTMLSQYFT